MADYISGDFLAVGEGWEDSVSNAESSSIVITGSPATGTRNVSASTESASITINGFLSTAFKASIGFAVAASIVVTGFSASAIRTHVLNAESGSIQVTGFDAVGSTAQGQNTLSIAESSSVVLTGSLAQGRHKYEVIAESGSVAVSGAQTTASVNKKAIADLGSVVITGYATSVNRAYFGIAEPASVVFTGRDARATSAGIVELSQATIDAIAQAVWKEILDAGFSAEELMRVMAAALAGKSSGSEHGHNPGTITFRDIGDTKDRIVAKVDGVGNRNDIELDET